MQKMVKGLYQNNSSQGGFVKKCDLSRVFKISESHLESQRRGI